MFLIVMAVFVLVLVLVAPRAQRSCVCRTACPITSSKLGLANLDEEVFEVLQRIRPVHILEFGSGAGTKHLCRIAPTTSIEHDKKWVKSHAANNTAVYAPLKERAPSKICPQHTVWYDMDKLKEGLRRAVARNGPVDVVVVDGPTWKTGRGGAYEFIQQMNPTPRVILLDDTDRKDEQALSDAFAKGFPSARIQRHTCKTSHKMFDVIHM